MIKDIIKYIDTTTLHSDDNLFKSKISKEELVILLRMAKKLKEGLK